MPSINFTVFVDKVEQGIKRCSIRAGHRFKVGDTLYLYTGMRTKACRKLFITTCTSVTDILIDRVYDEAEGDLEGFDVYLGEEKLDWDEVNGLARRDGFDHGADMIAYFQPRTPFDGQLVEWAFPGKEAA
jgi:hypothetical protein